MKISNLQAQLPILCGLALFLAGTTSAQTTDAPAVAASDVEIERGADELRTDVANALRRDVDTTNTALVFNAPGPGAAVVYCRGYDQDGRVLGRTATKIPQRGLRYIRASDLANGGDFVGSAFCQTRGNVLGSAVFIAPGAITNLDVDQAHVAGMTRIQFPVVAAY